MFQGKKVLITGGACGIGRAIAEVFARQGAKVIIADLDLIAGEIAARQLEDEGLEAIALKMDVAYFPSVQEVAERLKQNRLAVDILINNAAAWTILNRSGSFAVAPFVDTTPENWQLDINVSLYGTLNCCRVFLPEMIARGAGCIINIASDAGRIGEPGWAVYSAAKGGVIAFTKALAKEVGKNGIRVNAVSPSATRTEKSRQLFDQIPGMTKRYPLGRLAEPMDIAQAVAFLASDQASFITGQILSVNGGYITVD